jgi:hypothetical protein
MAFIPKELAIPINRKLLNPDDKERLDEFKQNLFVSQNNEKSISEKVFMCIKKSKNEP